MIKDDFSRSFGQVVKEMRLENGLSQEELALESDLDRTFISMLERSVKSPTLTTLDKISRALKTTPVQLVNRMQQLEIGNLKPKMANKSPLKSAFYGTSVSCGLPLSGDFVIEKEMSLDDQMVKNPKKTFFVKASGDSMMPTIWDGDILVIDCDQQQKNGVIILAQINNEFSVKRYYKTSKGIRLTPDNSTFREINLTDESEFRICGVIVGIARKF